MTAADDEPLLALVNASGFAFQLAMEHVLRTSRGHGWRVTSTEHPWRDEKSGRDGFMDLVLQLGAVTWVVECKRTRDASWVFLVPEDQPKAVSRARLLWVAGAADRRTVAGWDDLQMAPVSEESAFCVVRGTGESDRSLLERLAGTLAMSLDCLADEEIMPFKAEGQDYYGVYVPVIVTTAKLHVCRFDPRKLALAVGELDSATFTEVPMVRFRKAFSPDPPPGAKSFSLDAVAQLKERTVLVVNSESFIETLSAAAFPRNAFLPKWPWEIALERVKGK